MQKSKTITGARWAAVGTSAAPDAFEAGRAAASEAFVGEDAKLGVVFTTSRYDLSALLEGIGSVSGTTPVVGCSTAGEIASSGPADASVVVTALGGPGIGVSVGAAVAGGDLRAASAAASACVDDVSRWPHRGLLLLTDGLAGDQQEVIRGAYAVAGPTVPLVGGCAGDDLAMEQTFQLINDRVLTDAVVAAAIGTSSPIGIGVRHGWRNVGEPMLVTHSVGNRVYTLNDRPALDVYVERLNAPEAARSDRSAFTRFAMTHPFGLTRRGGEEVRFISDADFTDGSIGCIAAVPEGGLTWIMEGDGRSVLEATDQACRDALGALGDRPPVCMLAFDCIARRGILGDDGIASEVERISALGGGVPVAGFYTYGEIARTQGLTGFHNQTLVVLALS